MSSFSRQEQLRHLIDDQQERVRLTFPAHRASAVVALTRARDWHYLKLQDSLNATTTTTHNSYLYPSGWHKALQLCFGKAAASPYVSPPVPDSALAAWADQVMLESEHLAEGEQVLAHCETGFMRMQQGGQKDFSVWIASKKMPTERREREDLAWWTNALASSYEREMQELAAEKVSIQQHLDAFASQWQADGTVYRTVPEIDDYYNRLGMFHVKQMACHFLYPAQTQIGGCTVELYCNVLAVLIGWALKHLDVGRAFVAQHPSCALRTLLTPPQATLIEALSETLAIDSAAIRRVVEAYSLSHENGSYHCSVAGTPAPPLLRLDERHLVWSLTGLLSEPFLFLTRELRRRYSYEYHTAAHLREEAFRQDLYQLFSDRRFVRSAGSIELRGVQGDPTTDVDALIFDRKTGALALFELKSQDPFAYSYQERIRQRDYFYNAGKQVVAWMQWLKRNGANALLTRLDAKLVKHLKVQKIYIFVLGRYLAHFFDGPEFDHRAAWGTWPQVLRLVNEGPAGGEDAHPIQSLHNKLMKDTPLTPPYPVLEVQEITIGESIVYVYPDFKTYKDRVE
ncbi:MAG TPA: hypothetical protein VGU68_05090 [Ktedonobacteraceae bacterium]|nr:hypothetical protein [Ktedonobacteraceae bacterium]